MCTNFSHQSSFQNGPTPHVTGAIFSGDDTCSRDGIQLASGFQDLFIYVCVTL
ncbi:MAG: hypothetical protein QM405_08700 [Euryarchaeota archaeon]|nr:hypothetical protein [Euryarchaeota archaeon]